MGLKLGHKMYLQVFCKFTVSKRFLKILVFAYFNGAVFVPALLKEQAMKVIRIYTCQRWSTSIAYLLY